MISFEQAMKLDMFYLRDECNADGTAVRFRRNGKTKTWKRRPVEFQVPIKYGLKVCGYLNNSNAHLFMPFDITDAANVAAYVDLKTDCASTDRLAWLAAIADRLEEMGEPSNAAIFRERYLKECLR